MGIFEVPSHKLGSQVPFKHPPIQAFPPIYDSELQGTNLRSFKSVFSNFSCLANMMGIRWPEQGCDPCDGCETIHFSCIYDQTPFPFYCLSPSRLTEREKNFWTWEFFGGDHEEKEVQMYWDEQNDSEAFLKIVALVVSTL